MYVRTHVVILEVPGRYMWNLNQYAELTVFGWDVDPPHWAAGWDLQVIANPHAAVQQLLPARSHVWVRRCGCMGRRERR